MDPGGPTVLADLDTPERGESFFVKINDGICGLNLFFSQTSFSEIHLSF